MDSKLRQRNKTPNSSEESLNGDEELKRPKVRSKPRVHPSIKTCLKVLLVFVVIVFTVVFIVAPLVFRFCPTVRRLFVFMNYVNFPLGKNLSDPLGSFGLNCTRNFYLSHTDHNETIELGVWHILPKSRTEDCIKYNNSVKPLVAFDDNRPIFLYIHGNAGARGGTHRRGLYNVLTRSRQLDGHVITFDYRGFGDSTNVWPTANGLKTDAKVVYNWLISQRLVHKKRVIIWGHSLGTAVSTILLSELPDSDNPRALILEAPFTSIGETVYYHPYGLLYAKLFPFFKQFFVEPLVQTNETNFDSISLMNRIRVPLLILHAEDDRIVPFVLGQKLYEQALKEQPKNVPKAQLIAFNGDRRYGHKNIYKDSELPVIIDNFISGEV